MVLSSGSRPGNLELFVPRGAGGTCEPYRVRTAYGDAEYARLVALRDDYDSDNLFRREQDIQPTEHR